MKNTSILTDQQKLFLKLFATEKSLAQNFYLTGGTALAEYYVPYRYSEDLDFFSETEVEVDQVTVFLKKIKEKLNFRSFEFNTSYNRNLFFLLFDDDYHLKLEFTYFPFPRIDETKYVGDVSIDSVLDIAVNKLFTIYQKPRSRDFIDLYMIINKYGYTIEDLVKKTKVKFDWHIDKLKLGSQFLLSSELKDYPNLIQKLDHETWQNFWLSEAKNLKLEIIN